MPPLPERTCSMCGETTNSLIAVEMQWCPVCVAYDYGTKHEEPIRLNTIVADLHKSQSPTAVLPRLGLSFEQYDDPVVPYLAWRCFIVVEGRVARSSRRPHANPVDALRELTELLVPS